MYGGTTRALPKTVTGDNTNKNSAVLTRNDYAMHDVARNQSRCTQQAPQRIYDNWLVRSAVAYLRRANIHRVCVATPTNTSTARRDPSPLKRMRHIRPPTLETHQGPPQRHQSKRHRTRAHTMGASSGTKEPSVVPTHPHSTPQYCTTASDRLVFVY